MCVLMYVFLSMLIDIRAVCKQYMQIYLHTQDMILIMIVIVIMIMIMIK
jgi:hypothetical protein